MITFINQINISTGILPIIKYITKQCIKFNRIFSEDIFVHSSRVKYGYLTNVTINGIRFIRII